MSELLEVLHSATEAFVQEQILSRVGSPKQKVYEIQNLESRSFQNILNQEQACCISQELVVHCGRIASWSHSDDGCIPNIPMLQHVAANEPLFWGRCCSAVEVGSIGIAVRAEYRGSNLDNETCVYFKEMRALPLPLLDLSQS